MVELKSEPRSEDNEAIDASSLSALTAAFTRLAVAVEQLTQGATAFKEADHVRQTRSDAAVASLPVAPTPIDLRIADALFNGEFSAPPPTGLSSTSTQPPSSRFTDRAAAAGRATAVRQLGVPSPLDVAGHAAGDPGSGRWYCVSQGKEPGVYSSWAKVSPLVTGVPRAVYLRYGTMEDALDAYLAAYLSGNVIRR